MRLLELSKMELLRELLNEAQIQNNQNMAKEIEKVVKKHFPKSFVDVRTKGPLGSNDPTLRFALGKTKADWPNGIIENDPLWTMIFFDGFDKEGNLPGDARINLSPGKVKATMGQGGAFRINGQPQMKFKWRNQTAAPEGIIKKLDKYLRLIKKWLSSPDGKEAMAKFQESQSRKG